VAVSNPKRAVAAAIEEAHAALNKALADLDQLPVVDTKTIGLVAHALNNFLMVSGAVVELLKQTLQGHPEPRVHAWLDGLGHSTHLMIHTVSRLASTSAGVEACLRVHDVDLARLVQRACTYYQRETTRKGVQLSLSAPSEVPLSRRTASWWPRSSTTSCRMP
jgi:signal transduction histidine kinase